MMKLPYFSNRILKRLRESAEANVQKYEGQTQWVNSLAENHPFELMSGLIVDPPPQLMFDATKNHLYDAENAKKVFLWLQQLSPTLAAEERLWAYLAHVTFADYMRARWPVEKGDDVKRRYLFEGQSSRALSRNGIARLWWGAYLTRQEGVPDQFERTVTLFQNQNIQVSLLERNLSKCSAVRGAVLDYLKEYRDAASPDAFSKRVQVFLRELNLLGGVVILDVLPDEELRKFLRTLGNQVQDFE